MSRSASGDVTRGGRHVTTNVKRNVGGRQSCTLFEPVLSGRAHGLQWAFALTTPQDLTWQTLSRLGNGGGEETSTPSQWGIFGWKVTSHAGEQGEWPAPLYRAFNTAGVSIDFFPARLLPHRRCKIHHIFSPILQWQRIKQGWGTCGRG